MRIFLLILLLLPTTARADTDAPRIVASIKPLHSLVAGVMDGVAKPELLVPGSASPHTLQMKPSQREALEKAEIVFYIGGGYETFLVKPLTLLPDSAQGVAMEKQPGMRVLKARAGDDFAEDRDEDHDALKSGGHSVNDLHLWLDPANATVMVDVIAGMLKQRYPAHRARFAANAERIKEKLAALDAELKQQLAPVKDKRFIVFHDAYQYIERPYGVRAVGSVALHPESPPGARHVLELRDKIMRRRVACVFREPQFDDRVVALMVRGTSAQEGTLDPLGAALPAGQDLYFNLMRQLAADLRKCLNKD